MTKATATKTMNKVANWTGEETIGYVRWACLPKKMQKNWALKTAIAHGVAVDFVGMAKETFAKMTETEYNEFLLQA